MKHTSNLSALGLVLVSVQAHAVKNCVLTVPQDCEVQSTNYSALSSDTTHVIQVDCKMRDGTAAKYMTTRQAIGAALIGSGRDFLPNKITYETSSSDSISIRCR